MNMSPEEYLKERVDDQIEWYERRSARNKLGFIVFQLTTLLASSSIPVISMGTKALSARILVATLGALTAVTAGIATLMQFRTLWVDLRVTAEALKREKFLFITDSGPYDGEGKFGVFVERIESIISTETDAWKQRVKSDEKEKTKETR